MYRENPDGITWRVQKILTKAFTDESHEKPLPSLSKTETHRRGDEYLVRLASSDKTTRMRQVFEMYMDGKKMKEIMAAAQVSKGSVSGYLNEIEAAARCRIVRGRPDKISATARVKTDTTILHTERDGGTRRASMRDFHSFRVTWVTLALTAGVPLELVQKVTGHKTAEIVLKHYFQPGREDFRRAIQSAMPTLLTTGEKSPKERALDILDGITAKTWEQDVRRVRALVATL